MDSALTNGSERGNLLMVFTYLAWFPVMMILFLLAMIGIFDSQVMLSGAVVLGLLLLSLALWEQTRRP